jgi:hypothetical protein
MDALLPTFVGFKFTIHISAFLVAFVISFDAIKMSTVVFFVDFELWKLAD